VSQPRSPLLVFASPSPTVTPTPRFRSFIPNSQGIFEPQNGDVIRGQTPIIGTVNSKTALNPFERYELHITPSGLNQWGWLYSSNEQFWQSEIYTLDTTQLADGFYDLRLRIVYRDSNYDEYHVTRLRVANYYDAAGDSPDGDACGAAHVGALLSLQRHSHHRCGGFHRHDCGSAPAALGTLLGAVRFGGVDIPVQRCQTSGQRLSGAPRSRSVAGRLV
jgi:hypothetical protein